MQRVHNAIRADWWIESFALWKLVHSLWFDHVWRLGNETWCYQNNTQSTKSNLAPYKTTVAKSLSFCSDYAWESMVLKRLRVCVSTLGTAFFSGNAGSAGLTNRFIPTLIEFYHALLLNTSRTWLPVFRCFHTWYITLSLDWNLIPFLLEFRWEPRWTNVLVYICSQQQTSFLPSFLLSIIVFA